MNITRPLASSECKTNICLKLFLPSPINRKPVLDMCGFQNCRFPVYFLEVICLHKMFPNFDSMVVFWGYKAAEGPWFCTLSARTSNTAATTTWLSQASPLPLLSHLAPERMCAPYWYLGASCLRSHLQQILKFSCPWYQFQAGAPLLSLSAEVL